MPQSHNRFTNRADLLIAAGESIKMQTAAGIEPVCKFSGDVVPIEWKSLADHSEYEFPLAVVEGKPVFAGDELYRIFGGKLIAEESDGHNLYGSGCCYAYGFLSWNPPKPATIMVPLLREDAESLQEWIIAQDAAQERVMNAIREALEK